MNYNLIRNSLFYANTASGTGNVSLTWAQLEKLIDGNTTSSGVDITSSGVLYLDVDLSQRIKIEGIQLYANDLSQSSNIKFYYKNNVGDSYTLLTTTSGDSYYSTTVPAPSAPRYLRLTVSGVAITLYEFEAYNDDVVVEFGQDGSQYAEYIDDAPIGEIGTPQAVAIYNNSSDEMPANAYVCVDRTGNDADFYVEIANDVNGPYYNLVDGALISNNNSNSTYTWNMGTMSSGVVVDGSGGYVKLNTPTYLGNVPLITPTLSFYVSDHCWDYDKTNDKIYAIGSDGILKLWEYRYMSNTWSYIGEIKPGSTGHLVKASMCYLNGYIYCLVDGSTTFGRYNLSGAPNNWEVLPSPSTPVLSGPQYVRRSITSDDSNSIYCILAWQAGTGTKSFERYNTTTSGWTTLSGTYDFIVNTNDYALTCSLDYDGDNGRNYIYANLVNGNGKYIQRYNINDGTWNTTYLNLQSITGTFNHNSYVPMSYYDGNIWFGVSGYSNKLYKYSIDTATATTYSDVPFTFWSSAGNVGDSQYPGHVLTVPGSKVFTAHFQADRTKYSSYGMLTTSGTYTTPVFSLDNAYNLSYLIDESVTTSGLSNISYNANSYNGTIRMKSSNTAPLVVNEVFYGIATGYIYKWIPYTGTPTPSTATYDTRRVTVDRRTGYVATVAFSVGFTNWWAVVIYDKTLTQKYLYHNSTAMSPYDRGFGFDKVGGVWGYTSGTRYIHHFSSSLTLIASVYQSGVDFVHELVPEWDDEGCWYSDKTINTLVHLDRLGNTLQSIALRQPRNLCATTDNGCWVADTSDYVVKRYDSGGVLLKTVSVGTRTITAMTHDYNDGFWYVSGNYVYHVTAEGVETSALSYNQPVGLYGAIDGCLVCRNISGNYYVHFIDLVTGAITKTLLLAASTQYGIGVFSIDIAESIDKKFGTSVIPASYDPVWGTSSGTLQWQEVRKDGYFLPKNQYLQAEYTLRANSTVSPELHSILMAPAVRVEDIQPNSYKNAYIRTNIPDGVDISDYEARLKAWWGKEE